ncbi:MAG: Ig-like domain-containing protein [Myxococcota bacterium]
MKLRFIQRLGLAAALVGAAVGCGDDDGGSTGTDMGLDMTTVDMGSDAGVDMGIDSGVDMGVDSGVDMGVDAGVDMGPGDMGMDSGVDMGDPAAMTSMQIAAVRTGGSGAITDATITRVQDELSSFDPAGFFVQAERGGPALFVETDIAALTPAPAPGDVVSFTVDTTTVDGGLTRAVAISGYTRTTTGADVSALAEDISAATDVVTNLDDYESELVTLAVTITEAPGGAGDPFEAANVDTAGVMGEGRNFRFRGNVLGLLGLEVGCMLDLTEVIMWRFNTAAQPQAIDVGEVSGTCPTTTAFTNDPTSLDESTITLAFTRPIDPATFVAGELTVTPMGGAALTVASVLFDGTGATVTLAAGSELESGTEYSVELSGVSDYLGQDIDPSGNVRSFTFDAMLTPSEQIALVRATDGVLTPALDVENVTVTATRPLIGSDPAGFFVQADNLGPALFVAVDPATLTPEPEVGDVVSFTAEETTVTNDQHQVIDVSGLSRSMTGVSVAGLVQDLSAATDTVSALDDYESELVTITGTTTGGDGFAGTGHRSVPFDSAGVVGDPDLLFRFPQETLDALNADSFEEVMGVRQSCTLTVGPSPVWRFRTDAQLQAIRTGEVSGTCDESFRVTAGATPMATEVTLTFFRAPEEASVQPADFALTLAGGAAGPAVTTAVVAGRTVTLTLATGLTVGVDTTITVTGVDSILGEAIDLTANTALVNFGTGPVTPTVGDFILSEYVEGSSNNKAIEIANLSADDFDLSTCSLRLYRNGSATVSGTLALSGTLAAGAAQAWCNNNFNDDPPLMAATTLCDELSTSTVLTFNGDDALDLVCGAAGAEVTYDVFGRIGEDPGASWPVPPMGGPAPAVTTANQTLRKDCTAAADTDGSDVFDPATDYADFASDTFDDLGTYVCP